MATTMEVEVEELCTQTVAMTPIMSAATGFCSKGFSLKMLPVSWPPEEIKESEKKDQSRSVAVSHRRSWAPPPSPLFRYAVASL